MKRGRHEAAAEDFDAFYEGRSADSVREAAKTGEILALSTDGKGIVMRTADLREATRKSGGGANAQAGEAAQPRRKTQHEAYEPGGRRLHHRRERPAP